MIKIAPSILACDFANLESEAKLVLAAGADMLHVDVMDGHFVPNITVGSCVVQSLHEKNILPLDVHLMITDPLAYIADFAKAGAAIITFHVESDSDVLKTVKTIKKHQVKAALSLRPKTPPQVLFPYLEELDMVLVMTVEPGFGGQSFMESMLPKIKALRKEIDSRGLAVDIQVDGGISPLTAKAVIDAGANILVAGSSIFGAKDYKQAVQTIRDAGN